MKKETNGKNEKKPIQKKLDDWVEVDGWKSRLSSMQNMLDFLRIARSGSNGTKQSYCSIINAFCMFLQLNPDELLKLTKEEIEYQVNRFLVQWSGKTANNYMYGLRCFYRENRILNIKFPHFYQKPREQKRKDYVPTLEEVWKMIEFAGNLKHKAIIASLFLTGPRNSTFRALRYGVVPTNDLRFKDQTIQNDIAKRKKSIIFMVTPGMKETINSACKNNIRYYTFLPKEGVTILKRYLNQRKQKNGRIKSDELLFPTDYNQIPKEKRPYTPLSASQLCYIVRQAAKNAGIKDWKYVHPHLARVVVETILKDQPESRRLSQEDRKFLLGHTQGDSTEYYYDDTKITKLRKKCEQMIYRPIGNGTSKRKNSRKIINENELLTYMDNGWVYENATPSGKCIVSKPIV